MPSYRFDYVSARRAVLLAVLVAVIGMFFIIATIYNRNLRTNTSLTSPGSSKDDTETPSQSLKYRKQRDDISRELNLMKKAYGQQSCDLRKNLQAAGKKIDSRISEYGGWCADKSSPDSDEHVWDEVFSKALSKFLAGKSVGSFGEGPGLYKKHMDSAKEVVSYTAYDGAPFSEEITKGSVQFLDLTSPQYGLPAFDWVVSVEVGEHIPAKYEDIYLDNLVRHAREGVVLSWALPDQPGLSHVNTKPLVDVIAQMNRRGFQIDLQAGKSLRKSSSRWWLQSNINVYRRRNLQTFVEDDV